MPATLNPDQWCYPEFKEGQVLTHADLNRLRDHLCTKIAFHARALFGSGVACGLEGTVEGEKLLLTPGFALAPGGRELIREDPTTVPLEELEAKSPGPPIVVDEYPFIDGSAGGFTVILREAEKPPVGEDPCAGDDCREHSQLHCQEAELVIVRGRLKLDAAPGSRVFDLRPVPARDNPALTGFVPLQNSLVKELRGLVGEATAEELKKIRKSGPLGVDLLKVGLLNEVLYTLWGYYRCRFAEEAPCLGVTGEPAVALGWISADATRGWTWDGRFRHHFQLARALFLGIQGTRGEDICERYLDHIRLIVEDFEPPEIPAEPGGVKPPRVGGIKIRPPIELKPGLVGPPTLPDPIVVEEAPTFPPDLLGPVIDPREESWKVARRLSALDPASVGVLSVNPMLGAEHGATVDAVAAAIEGAGLTPQVGALPMADFEKVEGLQPAVVAAASDDIRLGYNEAGAVVAMGIVPTAHSLAQVPAITGRVKAAADQVEGFKAQLVGVTRTVASFETKLDRLHMDAPTQPEVNEAMFAAVDALREVATASATSATAPKVKEALLAVQPEMAVLKEAAKADVPLTEAHPQALVGAMDGVVRAIEVSGVEEPAKLEVARLKVARLRDLVGGG